MLQKLLVFTFSLLSCCLISGEVAAQPDSTYVQVTNTNKMFGLYTTVRDFKVGISTDVSQRVEFQNHNLAVGVRFMYKQFGLAVSVPVVPFYRSDFGKPRSFGFRFNFFPRSFFVQGEFRRFRGFDDLNAIGQPNQQVFRGDNRMIYINLTGNYLFNARRFSLRSAFHMINRQRRSAGSWLLTTPFNYQKFRSDSLRLPQSDRPDILLIRYRTIRLGLGGGYAYSFVLGRWSLTLMASTGLELRRLRFKSAEEEGLRTEVMLNPNIRAMSSLLYDSGTFFSGIVGRYLPGLEESDGLNVQVENWRFRAIVGWRFN